MGRWIMKIDYLRNKDLPVAYALLGLSAVFVVISLAKVADLFITSAKAKEIAQRAVARSEPAENRVSEALAEARKLAEELRRRNVFVPPPPRRHPVTAVIGIMGDEALINGRWYKAGDRIADAKIVAVEPTQVKIEWDGRVKTFAPITSASAGPPGDHRARPGPTARPGPGGEEKGGGPEMVVTGEGAGPGSEWFGRLSDEERARMKGRFEAMRERFMNMSPEERERFQQEMRARFGRRGPGGRFGGRGPGPR